MRAGWATVEWPDAETERRRAEASRRDKAEADTALFFFGREQKQFVLRPDCQS